jgi:molecular chaperone HtpG
LKEGIYEDAGRRDQLLALTRFKTTATPEAWRSLKDYVAALEENQSAIYYLSGENLARLQASPHLEGFRARGIEVLLLADPVDNFWVTSAPPFDGKPFKSVTQGAADLASIPLLDKQEQPPAETDSKIATFLAYARETLGDAVSDVRASDRLMESAVCLVAAEAGPDRQLQKMLAGAGRLGFVTKPILELNPRHELIGALAALGDDEKTFKDDAVHLLFDEARVLDGERPADARNFSERLARLLNRGLRNSAEK